MTRTLTRSYDDSATARNVVERLEAAGFGGDDISIVGHHENEGADAGGAAEGAGIGGIVGGTAGLLAGLGIMTLPGIGPVLAAGWLASTAAGAAVGAAAGGIVGALTSAGVEERDAHYYAETIRRGGAVVSVRVAEEKVEVATAILDGAMPIDAEARRGEYEAEGWSRFDPLAAPARTLI